MYPARQSRSWASVVEPQLSVRKSFSTFTTGTKRSFPAGIVQLRVIVPAPGALFIVIMPARYHTGPDCPAPQLIPVVSNNGFSCSWPAFTGKDKAHCHQALLQSP